MNWPIFGRARMHGSVKLSPEQAIKLIENWATIPNNKGGSRPQECRILFIPPLGVTFYVKQDPLSCPSCTFGVFVNAEIARLLPEIQSISSRLK